MENRVTAFEHYYHRWLKHLFSSGLQNDIEFLLEQAKKASLLCPIGDMSVLDSLLVEKQAYMERIQELEQTLQEINQAEGIDAWLEDNPWATESDFFKEKARAALQDTMDLEEGLDHE